MIQRPTRHTADVGEVGKLRTLSWQVAVDRLSLRVQTQFLTAAETALLFVRTVSIAAPTMVYWGVHQTAGLQGIGRAASRLRAVGGEGRTGAEGQGQG